MDYYGAMAKLFDRDYKTIRKHINNALKEELEEKQVCSLFGHTANDGKTYTVKYYNLGMIISLEYCVKSQNGVLFRKWANQILKDYLIKGYAINSKRLEYLEKTVKLLDIANRGYGNNADNDTKEILRVINEYTKALDLLDDYDHKAFNKPNGHTSDKRITYEDCMSIVTKLKFNQESDILALERDFGLKSIINDVYQSFAELIFTLVLNKKLLFFYI